MEDWIRAVALHGHNDVVKPRVRFWLAILETNGGHRQPDRLSRGKGKQARSIRPGATPLSHGNPG